MRWPSDSTSGKTGRKKRLGFTLLETLVAMAILALLVGSTLGSVSWALGQLAERTDRAWLTELARSVADEYRVTRDPALAEGRAAPDMEWNLAVADPSLAFQTTDELVEVAVTAWRSGRRDLTVTLTFLLPRTSQ